MENQEDPIILIIQDIIKYATDFDRENTSIKVKELKEQLNASNVENYSNQLLKTISKLRGNLFFNEVICLSEKIIDVGLNNNKINQQYGQALVELGSYSKSITIFNSILDESKEGIFDRAEAIGLLGRVHKQKFVNNPDIDDEEKKINLQKAIDFYQESYEFDEEANYWHGINLVALIARADRDNISIKQDTDYKNLAQNILDTIDTLQGGQVNAWSHATAAEACIALENWEEAHNRFRLFLKNPDYDSFSLGSFLRQLKEVWNIEYDETPSGIILSVLTVLLAEKTYGGVELDPTSLQIATNVKENYFEAILGDTGTQTYSWWNSGGKKAKSICLIRQKGSLEGVGTGFLINGKDLCDKLEDELYILTNAHVVSDDDEDRQLDPTPLRSDQALIDFTLDKNGPNESLIQIEKIIWHSIHSEYDAILLKLKEIPSDAKELEITFYLPDVDSNQRVNIIGHPLGGDIAFSIQDNKLIAHQGEDDLSIACKIHYRAPTEKGSSGSPVFNQSSWEVIGLHHAGGKGINKLDGSGNTYSANEAIWIKSISEKIKNDLF